MDFDCIDVGGKASAWRWFTGLLDGWINDTVSEAL
jgi:hypothetical protein